MAFNYAAKNNIVKMDGNSGLVAIGLFIFEQSGNRIGQFLRLHFSIPIM